MGLTKTEKFTQQQNDIAKFAKVLGHPARIAILEHLFQLNTCVCGDLVQEIGLAQSTVSQHLKELKSIGLIQGTISGTNVCYCINAKKWAEMNFILSQFIQQENTKATCC